MTSQERQQLKDTVVKVMLDTKGDEVFVRTLARIAAGREKDMTPDVITGILKEELAKEQ